MFACLLNISGVEVMLDGWTSKGHYETANTTFFKTVLIELVEYSAGEFLLNGTDRKQRKVSQLCLVNDCLTSSNVCALITTRFRFVSLKQFRPQAESRGDRFLHKFPSHVYVERSSSAFRELLTVMMLRLLDIAAKERKRNLLRSWFIFQWSENRSAENCATFELHFNAITQHIFYGFEFASRFFSAKTVLSQD